MEPAQLLAFLLVNVLGVERRGFAKSLGISPARLSQYTKGIDHVPDKRRAELAKLALATAASAEEGIREHKNDGSLEIKPTEQMRRIVGGLIYSVKWAVSPGVGYLRELPEEDWFHVGE